MLCGFGDDTSTGVYKVVRIDPPSDRVTRGDRVHVYTVGSGIGWRRKENIAPQLRCSRFGGFTGIPSNTGLIFKIGFGLSIWQMKSSGVSHQHSSNLQLLNIILSCGYWESVYLWFITRTQEQSWTYGY